MKETTRGGLTVNEENLTYCERMLYFLTESCLVICGIPVIVLFFLGIVDGLVQLVEQDDYTKWIYAEKTIKVAAGGDSDDVSDMLETHLYMSCTICLVLVIVYGQLLFGAIKIFYKYSGAVYTLILGLAVLLNSWSAVWVADNDCTDTTYYATAIANNAIIYGLVFFMLVGILILFLIGFCTSSGSDKKVAGENTIREPNEDKPKAPIGNGQENENDGSQTNAKRNSESKDEGK